VAAVEASVDRESALREALDRPWYHTIELAPGRKTQGAIDLKNVAERILPDDLSGKRTLDIGTYDGFWAFEMERRGAEVVAVDLDDHEESDWPPLSRARLAEQARREAAVPGTRFRLAKAALGSSVERVPSSIYQVERERVGGNFDLIFIGDLLLHLRDPVLGLERARSVLRPDGTLISVEPIVLKLSLLGRGRPLFSLRATRTDYDWYVPNLAGHRAWLELAGFTRIEQSRPFGVKAVKTMRQWHAAIHAGPGAAED
jgi:SAM-dependent methyltransferase